MAQHWTFGRKVGVGLAVTVALGVTIGIVAVIALRGVVASKDLVINVHADLLRRAEQVRSLREAKSASLRSFLLTGGERYLDDMRRERGELLDLFGTLRRDIPTTEGLALVAAVERAEADNQAAFDRVVALRRGRASIDAVGRALEDDVGPTRRALDSGIDAFIARHRQLLEAAQGAATTEAGNAITLMILLATAAVVTAVGLAVFLTRALNRQIGTAVSQVQSSSAELQSAATQQATGAREQASAMGEITTTTSELLATSRQIAEGAQHVAQIADQTAGAAGAGLGTVESAQESMAAIRRQVDLSVNHMLELGRKSQEIGGVLEIVAELAEQTNILSINATIEAAGAGESGKRFAVVADEIRKLADRVGSSTKEIRTLIDDVRAAVNTTVMATETGSKAVDAGSRKFGEVAQSFTQISGLVITTREAAREIELSTKQQSTAVEQVNVAITGAAQATRETEASAGQTLQTASQLAALSRELLQLVQPPSTAG